MLEALSSLQFLIVLNAPAGSPMQVVVKLTWEATYDPDCIDDGTQTANVTLTPPTAENPVGSMHTVTAHLDHPGGSIDGQAILFSVTGANTTVGSGLTDASGNTTFSYTGSQAGNDTITACFDADESDTCDMGEPTATATKTWISTSSCTGPPAATYESIDCRLDALIADLQAADDLDTIATGLRRQATKARTFKIRSEVAHAAGQSRKAKTRLRQAHDRRPLRAFRLRRPYTPQVRRPGRSP